MSKNHYKVSVSFSYDFETDKDHKEAQSEVEEKLNKLTSEYLLSRKQVKLEKLKQPKHRICLAEFPVEEVLPYISRKQVKREYKAGNFTYEVRMDSSRYFVFKANLNCVVCGLEGTKFCLEQSPSDKNPHFNLYGVENSHYILITKDHIYAKSRGGSDLHSNFQTMCAVCNNLKGSSNITLEKVKELRNLYNYNKNLPKKRLHKLLNETRNKFKSLHSKPVPKTNRKEYLTQLKSEENTVVTNADLRIWRLNTGKLVGKSIYEFALQDAVEIASIKIGTVLNSISNLNDITTIKLDGENCEIYQGYLF